MTIFNRERVALATRHGKAAALRPAFRKLGLKVITVRADTDSLGTFSGERERTATPLECALEKCRMAHKASGERYCIGSEGSFGPHPYLPLVPSDHEILCFTDFTRGYSVYEQMISLETNFAAETVRSEKELAAFSRRAGFPAHALLLHSGAPGIKPAKGIRSRRALRQTFQKFLSSSPQGVVRIETDMRAHLNPTRMRVIAALAEKLAQRLEVICPECSAPGFGLTGTEDGLPCSLCGNATRLVRSEIHGCSLCNYRSVAPRADGLAEADPAHCDYCNP